MQLLSGAAVCTTAFFSHPAVAAHGRRCRRSIPLAAGLTLTFCFLAYLSVATILTLTTVHEERGTELHMPQAAREDTRWTRSLLAILQIPCLGVSLLGTVQFLKGCTTSLVVDRLVCRCVGARNVPRWVVPFAAGTLTSGLVFVSGTPTMLQLMAMSPLFSNTLVCLCVLHARYQPSKDFAEEEVDGHAYRPLLPVKPKTDDRRKSGQKPLITINRRRLFPLVSSESLEKRKSQVGGEAEYEALEEEEDLMDDEYGESDEEDDDEDEDEYDEEEEDTDDTDIDAVFAEYVQKLKVATSGEFLTGTSTAVSQQPTPASGRRATYCVGAFFGVSSCITVLLVTGPPGTLTAVPVALLTTVALSLLVVMARIPQSRSREQDAVDGPFRVPLVPWQPAIAAFVSTCLAVDTVRVCWLPFGVWAAVGVVVYACCVLGRDHRDAQRPRGERICLPLLNPPPHELVASLIPVHRETMDSMVIEH